MTPPPDNWQDQARSEINKVWARKMQLTIFNRLVKEALEKQSYKAYQEALSWLHAEEREP